MFSNTLSSDPVILRPGLKQVLTRHGEYLSFSQVLRRLVANTVDRDAYEAILKKLQQYGLSKSRKFDLDHQAFTFRESNLPNTVELQCYDVDSHKPIKDRVQTYVTIRITLVKDAMAEIRDVLK